jgi:hypothetical protein
MAHRYTKSAVRAQFEEAQEVGLIAKTATLAISSPGDGYTRYSAYNTGGIDSHCHWLGAREACGSLRTMIAAFRIGFDQRVRQEVR